MHAVHKRVRLTYGLAALAFIAMGCAPKHPFQWIEDVNLQDIALENAPLRTGDQIQVQVPNWEELKSGVTYTINADGSIVLPLLGRVEVEGITITEVSKKIEQQLVNIIVDPKVRVSIVTPRTPIVSVVGEVRTPGRFEITVGERLLPALALAGGLTEFAATNRIYVLRSQPEMLRIRFRYDDLVGGIKPGSDFKLRDGDVIVVE